MKVIYDETVNSINATTEDAEYPVENLSDEHPKKPWKATNRTATLTADLGYGCALGIVGSNAESVSTSVVLPIATKWETGGAWESGGAWEVLPEIVVPVSLVNTATGDIWIEWERIATVHQVLVELTAPYGDIIEAGVLKAGDVFETLDPLYGMQQGEIDYSVELEMSNGSLFYRKRDVVRTYSFNLIEERDTTIKEFLRDVSRAKGPAPMMWLLTDLADSQWIVYAKFASRPAVTHDNVMHSGLTVNLKEVV